MLLLLLTDPALRLFTVDVNRAMFVVLVEFDVLRPLTVVVNPFTVLVKVVKLPPDPPEPRALTVDCKLASEVLKVVSEVLMVFRSSLKPVIWLRASGSVAYCVPPAGGPPVPVDEPEPEVVDVRTLPTLSTFVLGGTDHVSVHVTVASLE
jgi:hypothetical protein